MSRYAVIVNIPTQVAVEANNHAEARRKAIEQASKRRTTDGQPVVQETRRKHG